MKKLITVIMLILISGIASAQTKHVVLEEHTGSWCQWCPRGTVYADSLKSIYPNLIAIVGHSNDEMAYSDYLSNLGLGSAPSAQINRDGVEHSTAEWFSEVASAFSSTPVADVEVFQSFNSANRELTVRVKATFFSAITGTYKLSAILLEDGIYGPSPQYNQSNAYASGNNGTMQGYETLPSSIPGSMILYNHVARQMLGGFNGQTNSVPAGMQPGDTASYTFTHILPAEWNENNIKAVGLLLDPSGSIDNAGKSTYIDGSSNGKPVFMSPPIETGFVNSTYKFDIYAADPDDRQLTITAVNIPSFLTLSGSTTLGYVHTKATLEGTPTATGTYPVELEVTDGVNVTTLSYNLVIDPAQPGNWTLVGAAGFTSTNWVIDIESDKNGIIYALIDGGNSTEVFAFENGTWAQAGNLGLSGYHGRLAMASDGLTPYAVVGGSSGVFVKKYENGSWTLIGGSVGNGVQIGFDLDANDKPYVAMQDGNMGYAGSCYTFNGTSWELVGGAPYSGSSPGVWNDVVYNDATGDILVLWNDYNGGRVSKVHAWDGTSWTLKGVSISNKQVYFTQSITVNSQGQPVVAYATEVGSNAELEVVEFDGANWGSIGTNISNGSVSDVTIKTTQSGALICSFKDETFSESISAMRFSNGTWSFIGPRGFTNGVGNQPTMTTYNDMPYVIYKDAASGDKATVRYYDSEIVSVKEVTTHEPLVVWPNPTNGIVHITDTEAGLLRIYDLNGRVVFEQQLMGESTLNLNQLQSGVYILEKNRMKTRLIIQ